VIGGKFMKTVGELKEFIKDLPDDMLLVQYHRDMETSGYRNNLYCDVTNMKTEVKHTWDRFDGTNYSYEVLVKSEDGVPCLNMS
jgi:hypothetical protein